MRRSVISVISVVVAAVLLGAASAAWAAPGDLDPSFGDGGVATLEPDSSLLDVVVDASGRYLATGSVTGDGGSDAIVARFSAAGELDPSFGDGGIAVVDGGGDDLGYRIVLAPDGSIVIAALTIGSGETFSFGSFIARLRSDGSLDAGFGDGGVVQLSDPDAEEFVLAAGMAVTDRVTLLVIRSDDLFAAFSTSLERLTSSGATDTTFGGGDGAVDLDLGEGAQVGALLATSDGFVVGGQSPDGLVVARADAAGALDPSFGDDGVTIVPVGDGAASVSTVLLDAASGELVAGGVDGAGSAVVVRLDASGDLVDGFGVGGVRTLGGETDDIVGGAAIGLDAEGRVVLATVEGFNGAGVVHRLLPDGAYDAGFGSDGRVVLDIGFESLGIGYGVLDGDRVVVSGGATTDEDFSTSGFLAALEVGGEPEDPAPASVGRVAAADRVATAIAASQDVFAALDDGLAGDGRIANGVVVAAAERFPDALVGVPLAVAVNGPLLLTPGADLDPRVHEEIRRVLGDTGQVEVLGGTGAVGQEVENDLRGLGYSVRRHAGSTRFDTAAAVADEVAAISDVSTVVLATGRTFADALSGGAAAARAGGVVLLTDDDVVPEPTRSWLDANPGMRLVAVGGDAAAAEPDAEPIVGSNRYETSVLVAERFFVTPGIAGIASGEAFPDALSGGVHAAFLGGPLLLTPAAGLAGDVRAWIDVRSRFLERIALYGGPAALSAAVEADAEDAAG